MRLSEFEGMKVANARGRVAGTVQRVLFDAERPVMVGFEVRRRPLGHLFERPLRYVPRTGVSLSGSGLRLEGATRLERAGGCTGDVDWEQTVVWAGMPVAAKGSEQPLGVLKDVDLGAEGRVKRIVLTRGATSDAAIGIREIDGEHVLGFDGGAIRVDDRVQSLEFSGGLAAAAGKGTARAKVAAGRVAQGAAKSAAAVAQAAKRSGVGKRAGDSWRGFSAGVREGLSGADDEQGRKPLADGDDSGQGRS